MSNTTPGMGAPTEPILAGSAFSRFTCKGFAQRIGMGQLVRGSEMGPANSCSGPPLGGMAHLAHLRSSILNEDRAWHAVEFEEDLASRVLRVELRRA
eukprot:scaffold184539_cov27-Tisochrysis_lutea.AAC.5